MSPVERARAVAVAPAWAACALGFIVVAGPVYLAERIKEAVRR